MKNYLISPLLIGLLIFVGFGLLMMDHADMQKHGNCLLETAGIADCTQFRNSFDFIVSHTNIILGLFNAIPTGSFASLFACLLLLLWVSTMFYREIKFFTLGSFITEKRIRKSFVPPAVILLIDWFSRHENSPSFFKTLA